MKMLTDFGLALLGLLIFVGLAAIEHHRRKYLQRNGEKDH
jgi:hypothetical protein